MLPQPAVIAPDGQRVLLDDQLGPRFALLVRTAEPDTVFAALKHPVWDVLGAVRIAVLPVGSPPVTVDGCGVVVETDSTFADALGADRARVLLLRPDRYVAACFPIEAAAAAAHAVQSLLAQTWGEDSTVAQPEIVAA
jgi:3-(3-hydroxy-phenyl)propionate hydroxylase